MNYSGGGHGGHGGHGGGHHGPSHGSSLSPTILAAIAGGQHSSHGSHGGYSYGGGHGSHGGHGGLDTATIVSAALGGMLILRKFIHF